MSQVGTPSAEYFTRLSTESSKPCEHLEVGQFGVYYVRRPGSTAARATALLKCSSCGKFLTLDSEEVQDSAILGNAGVLRESMRTATVQLNGDLYERIREIAREEGLDGDPSKLVNELLALGLRHYRRMLQAAR